MKRFVFVLALFIAAPVVAQSHSEIVGQVKASLQQAGVNLSGSCGAFEITKRVAWTLRGEGVGLIAKPDGENCQGFSTDKVMYADGRGFDLLIDGGGSNGPSWNGFMLDAGLYRPAIDPGGGVVPPVIVPPAQTAVDFTLVMQQIASLRAAVDQSANNLAGQVERHATNDQNEHRALADQSTTLETHLTAAINEPGWFTRVISNRYVQLAGVAISGLLVDRFALPNNPSTPPVTK